MSVEAVAAEEWVYSVLSSDAELQTMVGNQIYGYIAEPEATFPYIIFQQQAPGQDVMGVGTARVMANMLYTVKVVDQGNSFVALKAVAARIDALLHGAQGTTESGAVLGCVRERPLTYVEMDNGLIYRHLGGVYRIFAQ